MNLHPAHLDDLRKSGLTDATIELMRVESIEPSNRLKAIGVQTAYRIPYLQLKNCPDFYRDKLFPPIVDNDGRARKYDQPLGRGCRLYVLERCVDLLQDFTKPIFFVEGEKKSAAGYQAGLGCVVGVGGIWNFLDKSTGDLIPELDRIAWHSREIYYVPDSDVWARQDLQQACYEFAVRVQERGGLLFYFIQLPPGGAKQGLDDFLLTHDVQELMKLPKLTLGGKGWSFAKKTHKAREQNRKAKDDEIEVESEEQKQQEIPQELIAKAWMTRDLIAPVSNILRRFVFLKDDRIYLLLSVWVLATYTYQHFEYMPLLWLTSPTKRSGKTRLLEVLRELAANPTALWINPTEAILFRSAHKGKTLFLDEVEKLRQKDSDIHGHVMAVLNSGFQKGGSVPRMVKGKDGVQREAEWSTYGPKVIAGISNVTDTISDRSLVIKMIRRVRGAENLERFRRHKLAKEFGDLVFQLKIWSAAKSSDIQAIYDAITVEPEELKECDDRFLDIIEPFLCIACLADAEHSNGGESVRDDLVDILKDIGKDRADQSDAAISAAIQIIGEMLGDQPEVFIPSVDLVEAFSKRTATDWIKTTTRLATFLSKLELRPRPSSGGKVRGYRITQAWFQDMRTRYSSSSDDTETFDPSQPSQTQSGQ
jgi:hypothetical protein